MNLGEFKAWLAGYLESCSASPAKRVKRIEEQLAEVRELPTIVPYPVYRNREMYPYEWTRPIITWDNTSTDTTDWKFSTNKIVCNDVTGTTTTVAYLNAGGVE